MAEVVSRAVLHGSPNPKGQARRRGLLRPSTVAENATEEVIQIHDGDTIFRLSKPIDLRTRRQGRHVLVAYEPLGIEESGETETEALRAFACHFGAIWHGIAAVDDSQLTSDARQLKPQLRSLVHSVSTL